MKILMISTNDPAGMGIAFTNAINRYTEHSCRLITSQDRYGIDFGKDIHLPEIIDDDFTEIEHLLETSDVFHFHMLMDENTHLGPLVIRDYISGKKIIHHHHGHPDFLINVKLYNDKYQELGRQVIVSTPDLLHIVDNATWVPNLIPLYDTRYLPRYDDSLPQNVVKVCQAPTRKFDKHTAVFKSVMQDIQTTTPQVQLVLIEKITHALCLEKKKLCNIVFDHMRGWFGISSLESLAQGKPVIAGLDDWNIDNIKRFTGTGFIPWKVARNKDELRQTLTELIEDHDLRLESGKASRRFLEQYWTEQHCLEVLFDFYKKN